MRLFSPSANRENIGRVPWRAKHYVTRSKVCTITIRRTREGKIKWTCPYYVEIKCQLDATDDIYCRFYCMLNVSDNTIPIIRSSRVLYRWSLPLVFGALVFKLSVWCGAEGYVSGLQVAACKYSRAPDDGHNGAPEHVEQAIKSAINIICCI